MARTKSTMLALGTVAPDFSLADTTTEGRMTSLADFQDKPALLVAFICNHCPYVKHLAPALAQLGKDLQAQGLAVVAISANDVGSHPDDSPENMTAEAQAQGYVFPYLYDPTQAVAKAYFAACTPDFFLFDAQRKLVYRGQFDDSRPGNDKPVDGKDMRAAITAVLTGQAVSPEQKTSLGCNIKWRAGNEPSY